jgi:hypothetical protein
MLVDATVDTGHGGDDEGLSFTILIFKKVGSDFCGAAHYKVER